MGRLLAYAAVLLVGVGIGWFARPAGQAVNPAPPRVREASVPHRLDDVDRPERDLLNDPAVRNALALSQAFGKMRLQ